MDGAPGFAGGGSVNSMWTSTELDRTGNVEIATVKVRQRQTAILERENAVPENSQKPYPFGFPVSLSNTSLHGW